MNIHMESQPKSTMRYGTWGDWYFDDDGNLIIKVVNDEPGLPTEDHQFLVALHELVEVWLCRHRGVTQQMVDEFDFSYNGNGEPGDEPDAPYRREHRFAMLIEHLVAHELGLIGYGEIK